MATPDLISNFNAHILGLSKDLYSFSLGGILLLRKKNSGWVGSSNAYNCLFTLHKYAIFGPVLLIMWVGGLKNGGKYAYVIKVWPLTHL